MSYRLLSDLKKATKKLEASLKLERQASIEMCRAEKRCKKQLAKADKLKQEAISINALLTPSYSEPEPVSTESYSIPIEPVAVRIQPIKARRPSIY